RLYGPHPRPLPQEGGEVVTRDAKRRNGERRKKVTQNLLKKHFFYKGKTQFKCSNDIIVEKKLKRD
ncbi:MAG: hypothetical protein ABSD71_06885, partial [Bacteroidales bacterium]